MIRPHLSALENAQPLTAKRRVKSRVTIEQVADCPFSLSLDLAHLIFPKVADSARSGVQHRTVDVPVPGKIKRPADAQFLRQLDATEPGRTHDEIALEWDARSWWLPNFQGVLRFRIERLRTRVILHGEYVPPFGTFGAVFDRFVGRRLARATVGELMNHLTQTPEAQWSARQATVVSE